MFIYKLTFASGKVYVGQTRKTVEERFRVHAKEVGRGSKLPVHAAWRKHGAPIVETLGKYECIHALNEAEIAFIAEHGCRVPVGYNLASGGNNPVAHETTRAKLAARAHGAEWRANMSAAAKARTRKPWSVETKAKMSASAKAAHAREANGARSQAISAALRIRFDNMTPEQRQAFSEARKRAWETRRCKAAKD